ncbi:MAG TPA: adenylate cyclase, partial [Gammaproteobacteria bacterium]
MSPTGDDVRRQLDRLLASAGFANAGRMSRFLKFVVEKTLAGEGERLKEYVIGVEVFDRDASYDPRLDSIVRVEAARLRAKLAE